MNNKYFSELAHYNIWANNIVMEWLRQISEEQWKQVITSSFSSVERTALHIVSAQKIWIDYWNNVADPVFLSAGFEGTKNDLIEIWQKTSADLKTLVETYPEEKYLHDVTFKWPRGGEGRMEFWEPRSNPHSKNLLISIPSPFMDQLKNLSTRICGIFDQNIGVDADISTTV